MRFGGSGSRVCDGEDKGIAVDVMFGSRFSIKAFCSCRRKGRVGEGRKERDSDIYVVESDTQ